MTERKKSLIELKAYSRHGDIYRWLRENYDRVEPEIVGLKRTWDSIAADIGREGVQGLRGKTPYGNSVRRIWPRVCRDVNAERERQAAEARERESRSEQRRSYPSRQPADLRPLMATNGAGNSVASSPRGRGVLALPKAGAPGVREGLVRHPIEPQRAVQQRVAAEADIRARMSEIGEDGRLTPRAIELTMAWSGMQARRADKWTGLAQGLLVLDDEVLLVEFETARQP
ncbi:hypothetical protein [Methylosinus sp. LW3]|uniref:hypothetical protein n=1 Tax=Methylosinus sp. LW3 TaxID=107635 RepID=UPI0018DE7786|nr:hypothetical protein [Methylosinus sp. LW3]